MVIGVSLRTKQVSEHSTKVGNIRLGFEFEGSAIRQVFGKLRRTSLAQGGNRNRLLLFHNQLVLFGGALGLESLPGKTSLEEIDEDVSNGFQVISSGLFDAQVIVNRSITGGSRQGASFALGNVLEGPGVTVALGETKVDAVDEISVAASPVRDKVGRLNVAVNQVTRVHEFDALQHLVRHHEDRLEGKAATALVELVFQRRSQQVHDHEIVRVLGTKVVDLGKAGSILQFTVDLVLVTQLRTAGSVLFKLDGHLFSIGADSCCGCVVWVGREGNCEKLYGSIWRDTVEGSEPFVSMWMNEYCNSLATCTPPLQLSPNQPHMHTDMTDYVPR